MTSQYPGEDLGISKVQRTNPRIRGINMPETTKHTAPQKSTIAVLKGGPEFQSWFNRLRDHTRLPATFLLDAALAEFARSKGFDPPPPR